MNPLRKLAGKVALAAAAAACATTVIVAETGSGSNCPTCSGSQTPCCIYYSNGNPLVLTCCRSGETCDARDSTGKSIPQPISTTASVAQAGCL